MTPLESDSVESGEIEDHLFLRSTPSKTVNKYSTRYSSRFLKKLQF